MVFPLYWRFTQADGTTTRVVPPFFWRLNEERQFRAGGLPLVLYVEHEGRERTYFSFLSRLFAYERAGTRRRVFVLWIPFEISPLETENAEAVPADI
ncbi:MAG: hypothetical protein ABIF71_03455 [Planctomycetota bacterium]